MTKHVLYVVVNLISEWYWQDQWTDTDNNLYSVISISLLITTIMSV